MGEIHVPFKRLLTSNGLHDVVSWKVELFSIVGVDVSPFRSEVYISENYKWFSPETF
jgi:hypothetical protein